MPELSVAEVLQLVAEGWALTGLQAYVKLVGEDEIGASIADLVTDLRHLADRAGVDWEADVIDRVERDHHAETHGEG